MTSLYYGIVCC